MGLCNREFQVELGHPFLAPIERSLHVLSLPFSPAGIPRGAVRHAKLSRTGRNPVHMSINAAVPQ